MYRFHLYWLGQYITRNVTQKTHFFDSLLIFYYITWFGVISTYLLFKVIHFHNNSCPSIRRLVVRFQAPAVQVKVSSGKTMNPKFLPVALPSVYACMNGYLSWWAGGTSHGSLCHQCVNGWLLTCVVKRFEWLLRLKMHFVSTVQLPFKNTSNIFY